MDRLSTPERPETYAEAVRSRRLSARDAQYALLEEAVQRGVPDDELPALLADAIRARAVPRVFPSSTTYRGTGQVLCLADDLSADELLVVFDHHYGAAGSFVEAQPDRTRPNNEDGTPRYTMTGLLPQMGDALPNPQVIAQIDSYMTTTQNQA